MQRTVTGLGSQMRVLVASVRRPADMGALAAQARRQPSCLAHATRLCGEATPFQTRAELRTGAGCLVQLKQANPMH